MNFCRFNFRECAVCGSIFCALVGTPALTQDAIWTTSLAAPSWTGESVDENTYVCNVDDTQARDGVLIWDEEEGVFRTAAPIVIKIETNNYDRMDFTFPNASLRSTTGGPDIPIANWRNFQIDMSDIKGSFLDHQPTRGLTYTTLNPTNPAWLNLKRLYRTWVGPQNNWGTATLSVHFEAEPTNPELVSAATDPYKLSMVLDCYEEV